MEWVRTIQFLIFLVITFLCFTMVIYKKTDLKMLAVPDLTSGYKQTLEVFSQLKQNTSLPFKIRDQYVRYILTPKQHDQLMGTLDIFTEVTKRENITWFLLAGSLLGSYRHHGLIPWDGDIDVMVNGDDWLRLKRGFKVINEERDTGFNITEDYKMSKVFPLNGRHVNHPWLTPYLDIFFYKENTTHLWGSHVPPRRKADIFPLTLRPFSGRMCPAPRHPRKVLGIQFRNPFDQCPTADYDYIIAWWKPRRRIGWMSCDELKGLFPFVTQIREAVGGTGKRSEVCREELRLQGKVLGTFTRSAEDIPVC